MLLNRMFLASAMASFLAAITLTGCGAMSTSFTSELKDSGAALSFKGSATASEFR
jgi:hypothetical protein